MTQLLHFPFSLSCIGEENGNPLQYSCLENPRDRGACWAAVYGVAQSWTRLTRLSSSSSSQYSKNLSSSCFHVGFPNGSDGKEFACKARDPVIHPWVRRIPWRRKWQLTPVFLPEESHGDRSLCMEYEAGYSSWSRKESDTPEQQSTQHIFHLALFYISFSTCFHNRQTYYP